MDAVWPNYVLLSDTVHGEDGHQAWRFVLTDDQGGALTASDHEPGVGLARLELLALVRGIEAVSQPARITIVSKSRYVRHGVQKGLAAWRANGWKWERFGRLVTVRDEDLWRRVDAALSYHKVSCLPWRAAPTPSDAPQRRQPARYGACSFQPPGAHAPAVMVVRNHRRATRYQFGGQPGPLVAGRPPQWVAAAAG